MLGFLCGMDIKDLQPRTGNADVEGQITQVESARTFSKFGKEGRVANATLKDDSGSITLTLWNDQIDQVKVGDHLKITKGWVSEWQGENQLSTGKFGSLEVVPGTAGSSDDSKPQTNPKLYTNDGHAAKPEPPARALDVEDVDLVDEDDDSPRKGKGYSEEDFSEDG